jgi:outer membrane PBP1 activator LpoA protein
MTAAFNLHEQPLVELFALGLDAYRLATWVHWIQTHKEQLDERFRLRLNMASGELALGREGVVERELTLAEVGSSGTLLVNQEPAQIGPRHTK